MNFQDNLKAQLERLKHEIKRSAEMSDKYDEVIDLPLLKIFPTKYIVVLKHREIKQTPNLTKKVTKKHHWPGMDAEF
jgi:predicted ATP-binding protein involved in virulence